MTREEAYAQNTKVWARRYGVQVDARTAVLAVVPGNTRPAMAVVLTAVWKMRDDTLQIPTRQLLGMVSAELLYRAISGVAPVVNEEAVGEALFIVANRLKTTVSDLYPFIEGKVDEIVSLVNQGLMARNAEKAAVTVANVILAKLPR